MNKRRFRPAKTFMGRLLMLTVVVMMAYAMLTSLLYGVLSSSTMANLTRRELESKLDRISELITQSIDDADSAAEDISTDSLRAIDVVRNMDPELLDSYMLIIDESGDVVYNNLSPDSADFSIMLGIEQEKVLGGERVTFQLSNPRLRIDVLAIGAPIMQGDAIIGGIFLLKPQLDIFASQYSVFMALLLSMGIVLLIATPLIYLMARRVSRPLRQMRDVAHSMAQGKFTARADINQGDEFSQLGMSLNHMAQELNHTISALTVERNRVLQILNGIDEGIIAVDTDGEITHSNPAVRRLFGVQTASGGDERGDPVFHALTLRDALPDSLLSDLKQVTDTHTAISRQLLLNDKGVTVVEPDSNPMLGDSPILLQLTITPIDDGMGNTVGAVALLRDITQAERLEQTRRDYVANVSHEMRTPLTALRGLIEPLRDGMVRDDETRSRYYNIMMRETMRLSRLINDLMELSRLQSGQTSLKAERVKLMPLMQDLIDKYASRAEDSELEFVYELPESLPDIMGNADRIEQVMVILLDNAMKYTPSERPDGAQGRVMLSAEATPNYVRLRVSDNGIGISESDLPHIFERFYKVDKAHSGMGSGLGLSIAHEIVQRMGQSLTVDSELGIGSTFTLTIKRSDA